MAQQSSTPYQRRTATAILAVYWLMLLTATHWPLKIATQQQPMLSKDKLLHFSAYAGLGFLLTVVTRLRSRARKRLPVLALWLTVITAGFLDEITQPLTARDFEWMDWLFDGLGACCGVALGAIVARYLPGNAGESYEPSPPEPAPRGPAP